VIILWATGLAVVANFLLLYLWQYLHASNLVLGLAVAFTILLEIPFFFFSKFLLRIFKIRGVVFLAHLALFVRIMSYPFLPNAWFVLPVELLQGVTFACMKPAMVKFASDVAPFGLEATLQGVFSTAYAIGAAIGALLGGIIYQNLGPHLLFFIFGGVVAVSGMLFVVFL